MKFFTSYYGMIPYIPDEYKLVSISIDIPEYLKNQMDIWDKRLAPNWDLFREYKDSPEDPEREKKYVQRFKEEVLTNCLITDILKDWSDKCGLLETYVLLCYETPDTFCHRHIVSEFLSEKFNIDVQELSVDYNTHELKDYKIQQKENFDEDEW